MSDALYNTLKRAIERHNYASKEDFGERLAVIYASGRLTTQQYEELSSLLEAQ